MNTDLPKIISMALLEALPQGDDVLFGRPLFQPSEMVALPDGGGGDVLPAAGHQRS